MATTTHTEIRNFIGGEERPADGGTEPTATTDDAAEEGTE